jgi:hypothetical protein
MDMESNIMSTELYTNNGIMIVKYAGHTYGVSMIQITDSNHYQINLTIAEYTDMAIYMLRTINNLTFEI